jgi:hypothetical protein
MNMRRSLGAATIAALVSITSALPASASPEEAERLFESGKKLLAERKLDEACPLLARSQEMDPADGTLLALGLCHEQAGAFVLAFGELSDVLTRAVAAGRDDRQRVARAALARITPRVGRLTIRLNGSSDGVAVTNDGAPVPLPLLGRELAVEPGVHTVELRRGLLVVWSSQLGIAAGNLTVVVVPVPKPADTALPVAATRREEPTTAAPEPDSRWLGWVIGGVGLVAVGAGGIFGVQSFAKWSDVRARCGDPNACVDPGALDDARSADHAATAANVLVTGGLVLVATGLVVLLWPRSSSATAQGTSRASFTTTF